MWLIKLKLLQPLFASTIEHLLAQDADLENGKLELFVQYEDKDGLL